jgi:hypothetical protein
MLAQPSPQSGNGLYTYLLEPLLVYYFLCRHNGQGAPKLGMESRSLVLALKGTFKVPRELLCQHPCPFIPSKFHPPKNIAYSWLYNNYNLRLEIHPSRGIIDYQVCTIATLKKAY